MNHRKNNASSKISQQTNEASAKANSEANTGTGAEATNVSSFEPALQAAISEIPANISKVIEEKLGPLSHLPQVHREELDIHEKRISEAETRISAMDYAMDPVENKLGALEKLVADLSERADDLENRGRRKNIRIVWLPEGAEGDDPTHFFVSWLPDLLNIETKSGRLKLERAHRSLAPDPLPPRDHDPCWWDFTITKISSRWWMRRGRWGKETKCWHTATPRWWFSRTFLLLFSVGVNVLTE